MDGSPIIQLIILVVLLILSGFFSSAETALTTVNKLKLRTLSEEGKKRAAKVLAVTENSGKLLSTILIGNNIVNISASALATTLCTQVFGSKYIGISTGVLTLLVLIFGEITPKTLATKYSIQLSMIFVYPIWILMIILTPAIWLLNIITGIIFKILHVDPSDTGDAMTESELRTIVDVSHEDGVIEQSEKFMISNVVDFGDALSKDIMIPRADVVFADVNSTYDELVSIFTKETYSRIPIYEDSKDNVIGLLYLKDLFFYNEAYGQENFDLKKILRKPLFVYEYQKTSQIFADMKTSSVTMAVVLDEYGVTSGIITMEDLIEEIVGEIRDEYDQDEANSIKTIGENVYDIDASIKLNDLNDAIGTSLSSDDYDSLAGFVIELLDKLPDEGEIATFKNLTFKVMKVNKNRIERITLTIEPIVVEDEAEEN
ncbi:MAG: hemolysin family protein [Clostridium sp.]|nr:hemolysin family protein [Clostridium sp.]MCM1399973.1 hemolysin family protein [Clostridium sp.]MCM1460285.1 hemolysin family protein [Bacteroides sp.]